MTVTKQLLQAISTSILFDKLVESGVKLEESDKGHVRVADAVIAEHSGRQVMAAVLQWRRTGQVMFDPRRQATAPVPALLHHRVHFGERT